MALLLAACQRADGPAQRISLDQARSGPEVPILAPDTKAAMWTAGADGQAQVDLVFQHHVIAALGVERRIVSKPIEKRSRPGTRRDDADSRAWSKEAFKGNGKNCWGRLNAALAAT